MKLDYALGILQSQYWGLVSKGVQLEVSLIPNVQYGIHPHQTTFLI